MTNSVRRTARSAATTVVALLALSGCIKVDLSATINADDTVDGRLTAAVNDEAIEVIGEQQADEFVEALTEDIPGASGTEPFDDGTFVGETVHFAAVPLDEFNPRDDDSSRSQLTITHDDGRYVLDGEWDLPAADTGGSFPELDERIANSAEFSVEVTFPGPVVSHNGDLDGRTVSWRLELGENNILHAESDPGANSGIALWVLAITVVATLVVMLLLYIQLRRHSVGSHR